MKKIAAHTLGCKVNQYDTQAMTELFRSEGVRKYIADTFKGTIVPAE